MTAAAKKELRAEVCHDLCVGTATCTQVAPKAFVLDQNRQAVFNENGDWEDVQLQEAADCCPMSAITVLRILPS